MEDQSNIACDFLVAMRRGCGGPAPSLPLVYADFVFSRVFEDGCRNLGSDIPGQMQVLSTLSNLLPPVQFGYRVTMRGRCLFHRARSCE